MTVERTCEIVPIEAVDPPSPGAGPVVSHESALWLWRQRWAPVRRLDAEESADARGAACDGAGSGGLIGVAP